MRERIFGPKNVEEKSCDVDLVTETDKQIEELFINGILSRFPNHR